MTAELAAVLPVVVMLLLAGLTVLAATTAQLRCVDAAREAVQPGHFLEVRYETLCEQPVESFRQVAEFAELPWSAEFEREIRSGDIKRPSGRWRDDLTPAQRALLEDLLRDDLRRHGYGEPLRGEKVALAGQR